MGNFTAKSWQDSPSTSTPVSAAALADLETRLSNYTNQLTASGPTTKTTVGGTYTAAAGDVVICNPASGGFTVSLPTVTASTVVTIVAGSSITSTNAVTVSYGSAVIFGAGFSTGAASFALGSPSAFAKLVSDGTNWYVVAGTPGTVGHTNIATSETRTNPAATAYGTLTTPDSVTVALPANGLIAVWYQATWQESVVGAARAAIFLNATQLQTQGNSFPTVVPQAAASGGASANLNRPLASCAMGLISTPYNGPMTADASTGQVLGLNGIGSSGVTEDTGSGITTYALPMGGPCHIFAAAGTYTVSVQFKATSGSVTASNRKLWVQATPFG